MDTAQDNTNVNETKIQEALTSSSDENTESQAQFICSQNKTIVPKQVKKWVRPLIISASIIVAVLGIIYAILVLTDNICFNNTPFNGNGDHYIDYKPIIYLYPETETDLNVKLGNSDQITVSYPKYTNEGWDVTAYPNGDLIDKNTGNKLYSLYWEGLDDGSFDANTGFVVKGEDSAQFLEEKLEILGLNYKEKEEFIVYWLPKLESSKYNYIYFETEKEINESMPLILSVEPDTTIRVRMVFEGLDEYKYVEEQTLQTAPERDGFTVVEWGGIDLSEKK